MEVALKGPGDNALQGSTAYRMVMDRDKSHIALECSIEARTDLKKGTICKRERIRSCRGLTLVELMIAIFIVGTLIAIAVPVSKDYYYKAQVVRTVADIRNMEKEIFLFKIDVDRYPNDLAEIGRDGFLDPWGYPYMYLNIEDSGKKKK